MAPLHGQIPLGGDPFPRRSREEAAQAVHDATAAEVERTKAATGKRKEPRSAPWWAILLGSILSGGTVTTLLQQRAPAAQEAPARPREEDRRLEDLEKKYASLEATLDGHIKAEHDTMKRVDESLTSINNYLLSHR